MKRALLALVMTLVVLGALEGLARVAQPKVAPDPRTAMAMTPHPTRLWVLPEGEGDSFGVIIHVDADHLRVSEAPGTGPLIAFTGDSTFFGHGLQDGQTLHDELRRGLEARGTPARVRTLATPGYSTFQSLAVMDEVGWDLKPSLLLIGNLWSDNNHDGWRDEELLRRAGTLASRLEYRLAKSALFTWSRAQINLRRGLPADRRVSWPTLQSPSNGVRRVPIATYVANLERLLDGARERGIGVVLIAPANREIVQGQMMPFWAPYFEAQRRVAAAYGVPLFEMASVLSASKLDRRAMFLDGLHPSADGVRTLTRGLLELLGRWPSESFVPAVGGTVTIPEDPFDVMEVGDPASPQRQIFRAE